MMIPSVSESASPVDSGGYGVIETEANQKGQRELLAFPGPSLSFSHFAVGGDYELLLLLLLPPPLLPARAMACLSV